MSSSAIGAACIGILLFICVLFRATGSIGWAVALTYSALAIVGADRSGISRVGFVVALVIAFVFSTRSEVLLASSRPRPLRSVFGASALAAVAILGSNPYTSFDMLNRVATGELHQDTAFHSSISAMLKNYGVASTGLNGLVETPYHVFSHLLIAGISRLSGYSVLEVYGVAPWALFAPVLFLTLATVSRALDSTDKITPSYVWGCCAVVLGTMPFLLGRWGVSNSYLISESYLVSLGLLLAGLPVLLKREVSIKDLILAVLLGSMIAAAKASVGLIYAGLWCVRVLMDRRQHVVWLIVAVVTGSVCWVVSSSAAANAGALSLHFMHFIQSAVFGRYLEDARVAVLSGGLPGLKTLALALTALGGFVVIHFWASWIVIFDRVRKQTWRGLLTDPMAAYSLASVAAGMLIVALFKLPEGAVYYFTNVAFFVSAPAVIPALARRLPEVTVYAGSAALVALLIVGMEGLYSASFAARPASVSSEGAAFIGKLVGLRDNAPRSAVLVADPLLHASNPVRRCTARPFTYPAVTEHPWINVIEPVSSEQCEYKYFGFEMYHLSGPNQMPRVQPVLPAGGRFMSTN